MRCAAVVSDVDGRDNDGKSAADIVFDKWDPEPDDDEELDPLLALCAGGADLSRLRDIAPDWLVAKNGRLGDHAPQHFQTRFASLQRIFDETRASLGR